jgi:hypothetical protein
MTKPATFLLWFQEEHPAIDSALDILCGTQTVTATHEDQDQDPRGLAPAFAGTSTFTRTHEDPDQDPRVLAPALAGTTTATFTTENSDHHTQFMATQTGTKASETPDQDANIRSYFAIPRTVCSSS